MNTILRVAVADDEPDMRDYFRKILPRLGHQVVIVAANGRDLYQQCLALKPELVITDIKMPEMDGSLYRDQPVPVILVSAYVDVALLKRAEANHILGYLVKPIKQVDLESAIEKAQRPFEQLLV